jgi:NAD(P)-dependent dehydrogenase (short-subunit alcohol dehydrogenase family)
MQPAGSSDPDERVAVVIGAGDGIGASIARALRSQGAHVVLVGRDLTKLRATQAEARAGDGTASVETVDITEVDSIQALAARVTASHGKVSVLVNSAGASITKPALDVTEAEWDLVHDVGLRGTFFSCQAFARPMAAAGYGKIVNIGSTWGATVGVDRSTYCAAKAGVHHLTAALATEWAPLGIRVNAIAPTTTSTPRVERRYADDPGRQEYALARIPLGRIADPQDVAGAALYLTDPASDFVTGHTLFVDGGWHLSR